jgi:hypothetical protein
MADPTRPFIVLYIVWHPAFEAGRAVAKALFDHFRRENYEKITGGTGISVLYRFAIANDDAAPLAIDYDAAETSAVIALADKNLIEDRMWKTFLAQIAEQTDERGLSARLFPVAMEAGVLTAMGLDEQAMRWCDWTGDDTDKTLKLIGLLTFQFCRMLRHYLEHLRRPGETEDALLQYLKRVETFLSHSKHDTDNAGVRIAGAIREKLTQQDGLGSFFDVYDIPPGVKFQQVLLKQIEVSAVVAIHTDSYSSREWCRREIIEAKLHNRPLVIANCISDKDERGFPYLGNVPIIRLVDREADRVDVVIRALLDEVLRDFLWQCRIEVLRRQDAAGVTFLPRPPELISLATLIPATDGVQTVIVYPDPPLGAEEERLFHAIAPNIQLRSATEWLAGAIR